ncbi:hypothetical protein EKO04_007397 [Ascochyta lentis]|uniref:Uncharacterized protein n=1 Tax=Ascochyta lentis TaxID=205686 RepID=A0A8H7J056_9PLEO|nr:hypothetical protein EKO04_007397 [Ascochyta lentis]
MQFALLPHREIPPWLHHNNRLHELPPTADPISHHYVQRLHSNSSGRDLEASQLPPRHPLGHLRFAIEMGRGGYDTTQPGEKKSSMGDAALYWINQDRKKREEAAAVSAAEDAEKKLIKSKKSRGIMAAKKAAKQAAVESEPADC